MEVLSLEKKAILMNEKLQLRTFLEVLFFLQT